jgi:Ca-activated chloride channel family protein
MIDGQPVTVKQPLPLPEGVSDYSIGKEMSSKRAASPLAFLGDFAVAEKALVKEEYESGKFIQASVELGEIVTADGLSKGTIQKMVKQQIPSIESCYQTALKKKSDLKGEVVLRFVIDSNGRIEKISLVSSTVKDNSLEQCIIQKIKGISIPIPKGKAKVEVTLSLKLKMT